MSCCGRERALAEAIAAALAGRWDEAHKTVQLYEDATASWIHAVLHRIEGDAGNAAYWYRRAGREPGQGDTGDELRAILARLGAKT